MSNVLEIDLTQGLEQQIFSAPERRRNALRRRIFEEAAKLFEEKGGEDNGGHERTTAEEIAARSDISARTFFRYFKSKTDAIYVDVPTAMIDHLALTEAWLAKVSPLEASIAASIILLHSLSEDPARSEQLHRAMSSTIFIERRSTLRAEWRRELAKLIRPYIGDNDEAHLRSLMISVTSLDLRDIAMEYWHWSSREIPVVDCFNKALEVSRGIVGVEFPAAIRLASAGKQAAPGEGRRRKASTPSVRP